jgi:hypothetical protein
MPKQSVEEQLESIHKLVGGVAGQICIAITIKKIKKSRLFDHVMDLEQAIAQIVELTGRLK